MFHIVKHSELYSGKPYRGKWTNMNPAIAPTLNKAVDKKNSLSLNSGVDWKIVNSKTWEIVDTVDVKCKHCGLIYSLSLAEWTNSFYWNGNCPQCGTMEIRQDP